MLNKAVAKVIGKLDRILERGEGGARSEKRVDFCV